MPSSFTMIEYSVQERVAYVAMNRAAKRNALHPVMISELHKAFKTAARDKHVRSVVLKGNGPAFSAGADLEYLQQLQKNSHKENLADSNRLRKLLECIYTHPKIVLAQVEGPALAGGCGLTTVCDLVFATPESSFGYTEVKIGFVAALVMVFLLRKTGESRTRELLLSGRILAAQEARDYGLVNFIHEKDDIGDAVMKYAQKIALETAPDSISLTKTMMAAIPGKSLDKALDFAARMNARARAGADCKKGIAAFLNKEKISW